MDGLTCGLVGSLRHQHRVLVLSPPAQNRAHMKYIQLRWDSWEWSNVVDGILIGSGSRRAKITQKNIKKL